MQDVLRYLVEPPRLVLMIMAASAIHAHLHGRERLRFGRQFTDPSTFAAPYNAIVRLYSRAPVSPYLDAAAFPQMQVIADNWQVLRDEGLRLIDEGKVRGTVGDADIAFQTFFKTGWKRFYLTWYGRPLPSAQALCPKSLALLSSVPSIKAAMFATLPPGGRLGRHRDPFAGIVRYHLGLRTPNSDACWIKVDGEQRSWRDGEPLVFDETFIHEAQNDTDVNRLILFCDVERPVAGLLGPVNRWLLRIMMGATGAPNEAGERAGAINVLYARLSGLHQALRRLKQRRLVLYRLQKWAAAALLVAVFVAPY